jgi:tRNA dimethylallyltransferase
LKVTDYALIITGPTASGKTALSEKITQELPVEIVNADLGQFYTALSIGTAKPDLKKYKIPTHLFNIIDSINDLNSFQYRKQVDQACRLTWQNKNLPLIVGGSLFYIKSIFLPPHEFDLNKIKKHDYSEKTDLWQELNSIDPARAEELYPNDIYRIQRALDIWHSTGIHPSQFKPEFKPLFNKSIIIFVCPNRETLRKRIEFRTIQMIKNEGWIEEVRPLVGTEWEDFFKRKGLIGYTELVEWIKCGENINALPLTIKRIQELTCQYAKRQITFWNSFARQLSNFSNSIQIINVDSSDEKQERALVEQLPMLFE